MQGYGTMAQQDASAVTITGGTAVLTSLQSVQIGVGTIPEPAIAVAVVGNTRFTGQNILGSGAINANEQNTIYYDKAARHALTFRPSGSDAGSGTAATFTNIAGGTGTITTNGSATAYNTSSMPGSRRRGAAQRGTWTCCARSTPCPLCGRQTARQAGASWRKKSEVVEGVVTGEATR